MISLHGAKNRWQITGIYTHHKHGKLGNKLLSLKGAASKYPLRNKRSLR